MQLYSTSYHRASSIEDAGKLLSGAEDGKFIARVILGSVDPGTRSRLSGGDSYAGAMKIGEGIDGFCVAQVVESKNPNYAAGDLIAAGGGWREQR